MPRKRAKQKRSSYECPYRPRVDERRPFPTSGHASRGREHFIDKVRESGSLMRIRPPFGNRSSAGIADFADSERTGVRLPWALCSIGPA